jgi:MOSC domain-containing protein
MADILGRVVALWRYPVKSMLGETLPSLDIDTRGAVGDRLFALSDRDGKLGSGKTTRRFRRIDGLFGFHAASDGGTPVIRFPDGRVLRGDHPGIDSALTDALGIDVTLAREDRIPHHDSSALHIMTTASLDWLGDRLPNSAVDARRFRPNIVIDAGGAELIEETWMNRVLAIGDELRVRVAARTERCVMVTNEQDELSSDPAILRSLAQRNEQCFGIYADVAEPGTVKCGDIVALG